MSADTVRTLMVTEGRQTCAHCFQSVRSPLTVMMDDPSDFLSPNGSVRRFHFHANLDDCQARAFELAGHDGPLGGHHPQCDRSRHLAGSVRRV